MKKLLAVILLIPCLAFADSVNIGGSWRGLNNGDSSAFIDDNEAQDLMNVDITNNGYGITKRDGYIQYRTINVSTWGVRGGYYFKDASGNDCIIHANDKSILKSVSGANYAAFVTTDTAGSYYDFDDYNGSLWRANSSRDEILKHDGSATTYYPSHPKGNQLEILPDRLVISGVANNINTLYFSALADFTNFTIGNLESSAFTDAVTVPGQSINAIKYALGSLFIWTKDNFLQWNGTNQFDATIMVLSDHLGTKQPYSIVEDLGRVYWQETNGHFYYYDGNAIVRISDRVANSIRNIPSSEAKFWTQTSQTEFEAGTTSHTATGIEAGSVVLATYTETETTSAQFASGTMVNTDTTTADGSIYLTESSTHVLNNDFENGTGSAADNWTSAGDAVRSQSACSGTYTPYSGSYMIILSSSAVGFDIVANVIDYSGSVVSTSTVYDCTDGTCNDAPQTWTQYSLDLSSYEGKNIQVKISALLYDQSAVMGSVTSDKFYASDDNNFTFYIRNRSCTPSVPKMLDLTEFGRNLATTGTFVSQSFDTDISSPGWLSSDASWTANGNSVTMQTQVSDDNSSWDSLVAWSTGSAPTSGNKRFIRYKVTMSTNDASSGFPYLDDVTLAARALNGYYISDAKNVGSNITSWGTFATNKTLNGGTIAYFTRSSNTEAGLSGESWTSQTDGAIVAVSTATWFQMKSSFTVTSATYVPALHDFTVGWNEGDIIYTYASIDKDHRILWSVPLNSTDTTNTGSIIYDQMMDSWLLYDVPFDAPARVGDSLYFGGVSTGVVYIWPSGDNDDNEAITAYWKSKDFIGSNPYVEKIWKSISLIAKSDDDSNLDITHEYNTITSSTTNISIEDSDGMDYIRINRYLPSGILGTFLNVKFGNDDVDSPFSVYGLRIDFDEKPWRVMQ